MPVLVTDPDLESRLISERQEANSDRYDEVWEGIYVMAPLPNDEHQSIQGNFVAAFLDALGWDSPAKIRPGVNVSDRDEDWMFNYRCPDVVVYFPENPAINHETHWQGGPDFLIEVVSTHDRSAEKLPFYASVGVREALFLQRKPWSLELYRKTGSPAVMELAGTATVADKNELRSNVLPVSFQLVPGPARPRVKVTLTTPDPARETGRTSWLI